VPAEGDDRLGQQQQRAHQHEGREQQHVRRVRHPPPARTSSGDPEVRAVAAGGRIAGVTAPASPTYDGIDDRPLQAPPVDALLLVSFGGPEGPDDVLPFMENVTRGRGIPAERLAEVSRHYLDVFGGVSPINDQARALKAALEFHLAEHGPHLPVYWGNRNWHPFLADTLARMRDDGIRHALAVVTSAFPSYSGCRQYREDWWRARREVGEGAPLVSKLRHYWAETASSTRWPAACRASWSPGAGRAAGVLRALDPAVDGRLQRAGRRRLRAGADRGRRCRGREAGVAAGVGPGVAVAQRPAAGALARAGRRRPPRGAARPGACARW
jgi:hypothetical protein